MLTSCLGIHQRYLMAVREGTQGALSRIRSTRSYIPDVADQAEPSVITNDMVEERYLGFL